MSRRDEALFEVIVALWPHHVLGTKHKPPVLCVMEEMLYFMMDGDE